MSYLQAWLAPTPYSPSGSVFLLILFYCMAVSTPQPTLPTKNHASELPPHPSRTHVLENMQSGAQAPAQRHDEEVNDEMTRTTHECVWALDFQHWCSDSNLALLPNGCLSSLLKHAVMNLPFAQLSSLLSNTCLRAPCSGFEAENFLPYMLSPTPVYRYKVVHRHPDSDVVNHPVWDTGKLRTLAFWNGMEPTVRFVWTIPTADIPYKALCSKQVRVIVSGKEREFCLFAYVRRGSEHVRIAVIYDAGQNKECQACELDVQFAFKPVLMHDQTIDAAERSLGAGIELPRSMLLEIPVQADLHNWRDTAMKSYATNMVKAADVFNYTRLVVCANIRFVASDTC